MVIGNLTAIHDKMTATAHIHASGLSVRNIPGYFAAIHCECATGYHNTCTVIS